jgi:hypothetical protein
MKYGKKEIEAMRDGFINSKDALPIELTVTGEVNTIAPLLMVEVLNQGSSAYNLAPLAKEMFARKTLIFTRGEQVLRKIVMPENANLDELFEETPFLLETMLNTAYAIMLKKLTPLSTDSRSAENLPETPEAATVRNPQNK